MNKELIDMVRDYYSLPPEVSDEEIIEKLSDSFGAAVCRCKIANREMMEALRKTFFRG